LGVNEVSAIDAVASIVATLALMHTGQAPHPFESVHWFVRDARLKRRKTQFPGQK
jgi:hypothetical protein